MVKEFKPTHIYVKTHTFTGMKYLGKTTKTDVHAYKGSGKWWVRHIRKHGYHVTTEVIGTFVDPIACKLFALDFSEEHDVVNSREWANLMPENGINGGNMKSQIGECNGMFGKKHSPETIKKFSEVRKGRKCKDATKSLLAKGQTERIKENSWNQVIEHNKDFPFLSYEDFSIEVMKLRAIGLGAYSISKRLGITSITAVNTCLKLNGALEGINQSWSKIKTRHPNFKFSNYEEFAQYCKVRISDGALVYHLQRELELSADAINRALGV